MFDLPESSLTSTRRSLPTVVGVDVLVAGGVLADAVDVHPPLVGEGAGADERLAGPEVHVGRLVDVARDLGQVGEPAGQEHLVARVLEGQVGDDAAEVDVAAPLADAVDRPLDLAGPLPDGGQRVGDGQVAVVVGVDADRDLDLAGAPAATASATSSGSVPPLVSQRTIQAAPASAAAWRVLRA